MPIWIPGGRGGQGGGLTLGPSTNTFSGADKAAAAAARDAYDAANDGWIESYDAEPTYTIILEWPTTPTNTVFQARRGGAWADVSALVRGPRGDTGGRGLPGDDGDDGEDGMDAVLPADSEFGSKAFRNPPTDLDDTEKETVRDAIGAGTGSGTALTDTEIGDKAFSNPPSDLTDEEKETARDAIGAGTGDGGTSDGSGLSSVETDDSTIEGDGTSGDPIKIKDGGVGTDQLASSAVTQAKIGANQVSTGKIKNNAVTTAKIGDAQITPAKLDAGDDTKKEAFRTAIGSPANYSDLSGEVPLNAIPAGITRDTELDAHIPAEDVLRIPSAPPADETRYWSSVSGSAAWRAITAGNGESYDDAPVDGRLDILEQIWDRDSWQSVANDDHVSCALVPVADLSGSPDVASYTFARNASLLQSNLAAVVLLREKMNRSLFRVLVAGAGTGQNIGYAGSVWTELTGWANVPDGFKVYRAVAANLQLMSVGSPISLVTQIRDFPAAVTGNAYTDAEKAKLAAIEANATADQTGQEIKDAYEGQTDTNAFTDTEKTKLGAIEENATADQTAGEIKNALEGLSGNNRLSYTALRDAPAGDGSSTTVEGGYDVDVITRWMGATDLAAFFSLDVGDTVYIGDGTNTGSARLLHRQEDGNVITFALEAHDWSDYTGTVSLYNASNRISANAFADLTTAGEQTTAAAVDTAGEWHREEEIPGAGYETYEFINRDLLGVTDALEDVASKTAPIRDHTRTLTYATPANMEVAISSSLRANAGVSSIAGLTYRAAATGIRIVTPGSYRIYARVPSNETLNNIRGNRLHSGNVIEHFTGWRDHGLTGSHRYYSWTHGSDLSSSVYLQRAEQVTATATASATFVEPEWHGALDSEKVREAIDDRAVNVTVTSPDEVVHSVPVNEPTPVSFPRVARLAQRVIELPVGYRLRSLIGNGGEELFEWTFTEPSNIPTYTSPALGGARSERVQTLYVDEV